MAEVANGKHFIDPRNDTTPSFACAIPVPSVDKTAATAKC